MKRHLLLICVFVSAVGLASCSDSTLTTVGGPYGGASDGADDPTTQSDIDALNQDLRTTTREQGSFLDPCEDDIECLSRYCIQFQEDYVCTELCAGESCEPGWHCATLENSGSDAVRLCIPNPESLCRQCSNNTDCGGLDDMCHELNGLTVCGRDCTTNPCPQDYVCNDVTDLAGGTGRQCVPIFDRCSCPEVGASRPCVAANGYGVCEGIEVCQGSDGWSECTAPKPIEEECDGIDNNCDGAIDEGLVTQECFSPTNELGQCAGTETCQGVAGWSCDARTPSIELCDGLDNDCNGIVDDGLCFDGNPCTDDVCDPETDGCFFVNRAGACDDGNLCTENTVCLDGACTGGPRNCNDGNDCTADRCDPGVGCVSENQNGLACETGNLCTADTCQEGICVQGGAERCPSDNSCERVTCVPAVGCQYEPLSGISCEDGDVCTQGDFCSNGRCVEGGSACAGVSCQCDGIGIKVAICVELFNAPSCICTGVCN